MKQQTLKWCVIFLAVALVVLMARIAGADEPVTMYCVCTDSHVNIREAPSTKSAIGGRLDFGDSVQVSGSTRDRSGTTWYRIDGITEMGSGYVCANYLIDSKPTRCDKAGTISASGRVAAYRRVDGPRKTWVKNGAAVRIRIYSDDWCQTDKGWIRTEYIRTNEE